jgi:hypothetical protein
MVTISISAEAYLAIVATMPEGSYTALRDDRGGYAITPDRMVRGHLKAMRRPGRELQRRDPEAREGAVTPVARAEQGLHLVVVRLAGLPIQVPAVSPRADPSPECAGRFAFLIPCCWRR